MAEDRYLELFLEEAGEQIEELSQALLRLEKEQTNLEVINDVFRNAHTLKSSAAFVGLDDLSLLAHHMEDVLHMIRSGALQVTTPMVSLLFRCLDRIKSAVAVVHGGGRPDDRFADLIQALDEVKPAGGAKAPATSPSQASASVTSSASPSQSADIPSSVLSGAVAAPYSSGVPSAPYSAESSDSFELSFGEQEMLKSQAGTSRIYEGLVRLDPESPMKGLRFMLLSQNLKKAGSIFKCSPSEAELDSGSSSNTFRFFFYGDISSAELTKLCQVDMVEEVRVSEKTFGKLDAGKPAQEETAVKTRNIKVSSEKIDYLLNSVGELVITNSGLQKTYEDLQGEYRDSPLLAELKSRIDQAARIARDLQSGIMKTRMIPVGLVFHRFTRPVRDLALELGKEVEFEFHGEETELDKNIIDGLNEPLLHIVRNSLDHGIETPEQRRAAGKPPVATLGMHAYQSGNSIFLEVRDDGRGLNKEAILKRARENGLVTPEAVPSDDEIYNFIFQAGFSTAEKVTDLSGRGVGMNVVKKMVQEFKGSITIRNEPGQGCAFVLQFPLTLAIVAAILVRVADEQYAFPLSDVVETIKIDRREITTLQGRDIIHLRGDILPVFSLGRLMGMHGDSGNEEFPVIIASVGGRKLAFLVEDMIGKKEIVIKSLEQNFRAVLGLIGACLMGDGSIVMVLDVHGLMELAQKESSQDSSLRALDALAAMEDNAVVATRRYAEKIESMNKRIRVRAHREPGQDRREESHDRHRGEGKEDRPVVQQFVPQMEVRVEKKPEASTPPAPVAPTEDEFIDKPHREALEILQKEREERTKRAEIHEPHARISLSEADFAKLTSVVNTGTIQAGMVLSQLLGTEVEVSVPDFQAIDFDRLPDFLPPDPLVGVFLSTEDNFRSILLLVFDEETGYKAAADLMGLPVAESRSISEEDLQSVMSELTNIVCASILNALANKTGMSIPPTVPGYLHGPGRALIEQITKRDADVVRRKLLYFSTDFYRGEMELLGRIFFMPQENSLAQIVKKI